MAQEEGLVFDGISLNDQTNWIIQDLDMTPPNKRLEWITGADADGSVLGRDPLFENREIKVRLRAAPQASMDTALAKMGSIIRSLEEAELQDDGLALVWTPAQSTKSLTYYVLSGQVTGLPIELTGDDAGWFLRTPSPVMDVTFTCRPYGYGPSITVGTVSGTAPVLTQTIGSVLGDVPAEGQLTITDPASQSRRFIEWGLEQLHYDSGASLIVDSTNMTVTGYAGSKTTLAAGSNGTAYPNSSNVVKTVLTPNSQLLCSTGNLSHVGTYRVIMRVATQAFGFSSGIYYRLNWQQADGPFASNDWVSIDDPPSQAQYYWRELDMGLITIDPVDFGTQRWQGVIEAYSPGATGAVAPVAWIDYLLLIPAAEGYGRGRGVWNYQAGVIVAYDDFDSTTSGNNLSTRTMPLGGNWATSGATGDFKFHDAPSGEEDLNRSTTGDSDYRYAIMGSTNYTDCEVGCRISRNGNSPQGYAAYQGLILRWTNSSNHLRVLWSMLDPASADQNLGIMIMMEISGSATFIFSDYSGTYNQLPDGLVVDLKAIVYASGRGYVLAWNGAGALVANIPFYHSALATGGSLASGKPGIVDINGSSTAFDRAYDNPYAATPSPEPIVVYSGRSAQITSDAAVRGDSSGTYYGNINQYRGSRFYIPPAGPRDRTSRLAVRARRADAEVFTSPEVTDNLTIVTSYVPRYVGPPR